MSARRRWVPRPSPAQLRALRAVAGAADHFARTGNGCGAAMSRSTWDALLCLGLIEVRPVTFRVPHVGPQTQTFLTARGETALAESAADEDSKESRDRVAAQLEEAR